MNECRNNKNTSIFTWKPLNIAKTTVVVNDSEKILHHAKDDYGDNLQVMV